MISLGREPQVRDHPKTMSPRGGDRTRLRREPQDFIGTKSRQAVASHGEA